MARVIGTAVMTVIVLAGCNQRDRRVDQQSECRQLKGVYHQGEDWDDDVCVISRDKVILFDNREPSDS